jgi:hypothetical protein
MIRFLAEAGPFIFPIILLTLVIALLVLWNVVFLLVKPGRSLTNRRQSINSVLFWGGVAAVLGILGQWMGIHSLTRVIAEQGIVNPQMVAYGISESLLTPIAGTAVLAAAALAWFLLRLGLWSVEQRA